MRTVEVASILFAYVPRDQQEFMRRIKVNVTAFECFPMDAEKSLIFCLVTVAPDG
jgi:hypothetical protein